MLDTEKKAFVDILTPKLKTFRMDADADVLTEWWNCLCGYELRLVEAALNRFMVAGDDFFVPRKIIKIIDALIPDGRLGADEAWAMYPKDERSSAVISNEMAEAMRDARGLLERGDEIAARMAFRDAYNRIVEANRARGIPPQWFPSLGHDPEGREQALKAAVEKGRIGQDQATALIPPPKDNVIASALGGSNLLEFKGAELTQEQRQKIRDKTAQLRRMIGSVT